MYFSRCATAQNVEILAKMPHLIHKKSLGEEICGLWEEKGEESTEIINPYAIG